MRTIFLIGGFVGFSVTAVSGFAAGRAMDLVLRDSTIGCLAGAILFKWFWGVWLKALTHAVAAKRAALAAAEEAAAATPAPAVPAKSR